MKARQMKARQWKLIRDLDIGEYAIHTGCWQKEVEPGKFIVLPTKTSSQDRGLRLIHFQNHSYIPGQGEAIFGLNDIVEV